MTITYQEALTRCIEHREIFQDEMVDLMRQLMRGEIPETIAAALLMGLRVKKETVDEITAAATVMREFATPVQLSNADAALDMCGTGGDGSNIMVCERGASFGYNNLVSDMRSLALMRQTDCPVVFDATHSVQLPGGQGSSSGGQREFVPVLARAAVAAGISGLFMETHPDPAKALSDGPNQVPLAKMKALLQTLKVLDETVKSQPFLENDFGLWFFSSLAD